MTQRRSYGALRGYGLINGYCCSKHTTRLLHVSGAGVCNLTLWDPLLFMLKASGIIERTQICEDLSTFVVDSKCIENVTAQSESLSQILGRPPHGLLTKYGVFKLSVCVRPLSGHSELHSNRHTP